MSNVFRTFPLIFCIFFLNQVRAQARIVLNQGVNVVIDNGAKLLIENPSSNALTQIGASNHIISENILDEVIWEVGASTGLYEIPWWKPGSGFVSVSVSITTPGDSDGKLIFSTYGTSNTNLPYPPTVTNMTVVNGVAMDGSLSVVDRFWKVEPNGYLTKPTAQLSFKYINSELSGTNLIDVNDLKMQRWTGTTWDNVAFGSNNPITQTTTAAIAAVDFYSIWILESSTIPLNVSYSDIQIDKVECTAELIVKDYKPDGMDKLKISRSKDGLNWTNIGYFEDCNSNRCIFLDDKPLIGLSYYKFENEDENGFLELFEIQSYTNNCDEKLVLFPNPTCDYVNIIYPKNCTVDLFDQYGKNLGKFEINTNHNYLNLSHLQLGEYLLFIQDVDGNNFVQKLTKI